MLFLNLLLQKCLRVTLGFLHSPGIQSPVTTYVGVSWDTSLFFSTENTIKMQTQMTI